MPLNSLFIMATSYLQSDFKFIVEDIEDIDLEYKNLILPRYGALASVPILIDAIIVVLYPLLFSTDSRSPISVSKGDLSAARSHPSGSIGRTDYRVRAQASHRLSNSPRSTPVPNSSNNEGVSPAQRASEDLFSRVSVVSQFDGSTVL
jgi:hypothetical protein